jgi:pyruvate ferredoxin oxidoreductase alpha subunit
MNNNKEQILEGSRAIALTIKNIGPAVVSAYPITPQTHIVEDLAKFKADGTASYEYLKAESEFAAASIVLGASAAGARVYSATSSQGLLLMAEVIFNIAGMRLPIVMTDANRALSAPISIWNDQQDVMTIRDSGWILLFSENHQEAVDQHIIAYKLAESLKLPVMVNVDGFILTHSYEPVSIPTTEKIKKYLPDYIPTPGEYLDPKNPMTLGAFATPADYMEIREDLHDDLTASLKNILVETEKYHKIVRARSNNKNVIIDNGLVEYTGPKNPAAILVAMGSSVGTLKTAVKDYKNIGILKIRTYRPFPVNAILEILKQTKKIAVIEKAIGLGMGGPLATDLKAVAYGQINGQIKNYVIGLGGRDFTVKMAKNIIDDIMRDGSVGKLKFVNK